MKLHKILEKIDYQLIQGTLDINIQDLSYDSRKIEKNMAFIALIGIDNDGHDFCEKAIENGCNCLIICRDISLVIPENITVIKLKDTRRDLALLSANFFEHPAESLIKIAITGTKGKTSTAWMIKQILEKAHHKVGVIGTLGTTINNHLIPHKNTTPESYQIQKFMRMMVENGVEYLIMEASSQALKVGRIHNIQFEYGIFTNLSIDHIGPREHPTYQDYVQSKALLFKQCKIGILNQDEKEYSNMIQNSTCQIYTYGTKKSDLTIKNHQPIHTDHFLGNTFTTEGLLNQTFKVSAPGNFSIYNATAAILLCHLRNIEASHIKEGLEKFKVAGRCEIINMPNSAKVIIDFAHNKISMESIIKTMRQYHPNHIITIFGCGGGRSFDRRYELGVVSGSLSDLSIITTDNPRNDNIDEINQDIAKGIESQKGKYQIIKDRKTAILYALEQSQKKDIILLLGKGHETYQEIKGTKYPFNEKEIIQQFLTDRSNH